MAIAFESAQTNTATTNANVVVTKPVSLAVGNLMVAHVCTYNNDSTDFTISLPSGWTSIVTTQSINASPVYINYRSFYKVADSSDVSASDFTFSVSSGTPDVIGGAIIRITGQALLNVVSSSATGSQSDSASPSINASITPTQASSLILQLWTAAGGSAGPFDTYAIATDNPSWSEAYDVANTIAFACGYAIRTQTTSTGNVSCANGGDGTTDSGVIILAINPSFGVTLTSPTDFALANATGAVPTPTISGGMTATPSTINVTSEVKTPAHNDQADWSSQGKSSGGTWTPQTKS